MRKMKEMAKQWVKKEIIARRVEWIEVGQGDEIEKFASKLTDHMEKNNIAFFWGGESKEARLRVNLLKEDHADFLEGVVNFLERAEISVYYCKKMGGKKQYRKLTSTASEVEDLCIIEEGFSIDGKRYQYYRVVEVEVWDKKPTYNKTVFLTSSRKNPYIYPMKKETFKDICGGKYLIDGSKDSREPEFDVDVVYTWVDDKDPQWLEKKGKYKNGVSSFGEAARGGLDERFRNRDELKYSLRSLEMFAPFVRKIFLVTDDQVPSWLNISNEKIEVVSHSDIFGKKTSLPTFNSSAIETQLHHIPGLSEHFIYLNDDFFFGSLCEKKDFFHGNGVIKFFPSSSSFHEYDISVEDEEYKIADGNAIKLIKECFPTVGRSVMLHAPYASKKSLLYKIESDFQHYFDICSAERFRSHNDLRPIAFMQYHYGYNIKEAMPAKISNRYLALWKPNISEQFRNTLFSRKYKTICINDVSADNADHERIDNLVFGFLESYFPKPSSFEIQ